MKRLLLYILLWALSAAAFAQTHIGQKPRAERQDDRVGLHAQLPTGGLRLHRQQMLTVTPVLRSLDRTHQVVFPPIAIVGKTRLKAIERAVRLDGVQLDPEPSQIYRYERKSGESIPFDLETFYEPWMQQAELVLVEQVTGCLNKIVSEDEYRILSPVFATGAATHPAAPVAQAPVPASSAYYITYAEPPVEAVKQRNDSHTARLNFTVNNSELRRGFMNNAATLDEIDRIISEVENDDNLTITEFRVTGYASPEGLAGRNIELSEERAKAFVSYVLRRHHIPSHLIRTDWVGDDWDGLRRMMETSGFAGRYSVLAILDGTPDYWQRKSRLKELSGYGTLLREYFPFLRRNEYTISYIARPFDTEEAKLLIKTKPQHLSLNEMYLVANSYPKDSREFKEVFDIAVRMYPYDDYANLNSAALDIENGALDVALERSLRVNRPEAWNNIGYIYVQKQDYVRAAEFFQKAADAGLALAAENLLELNRFLGNR